MNEDRLVAGFISGTIAALIQNIYALIIKALGWTDRAFSDFAGVLIMFKSYPGPLAFIIGVIAHLTFGGTLGYFFALLVKNTSSKYFLLKVIIWGPFLWFAILGIGAIFRLPLFTVIPPVPALTTLIGASIYSFSNGYILRYLEKKTNLI